MLRGKMAFKRLYFRLAFAIFMVECKKSHVTSVVTMKFNNSQLQSNMFFNSRHIQFMMKKLVIVRVIHFLLLFFCCMWVHYKKKHCCLIRQAGEMFVSTFQISNCTFSYLFNFMLALTRISGCSYSLKFREI